MHALQNTKQLSKNYYSDLCPAPATPIDQPSPSTKLHPKQQAFGQER